MQFYMQFKSHHYSSAAHIVSIMLYLIVSFHLVPVGLSECSATPCRNGGTCYAVENTYRCHCGTGFKGRHCEGTKFGGDVACETYVNLL